MSILCVRLTRRKYRGENVKHCNSSVAAWSFVTSQGLNQPVQLQPADWPCEEEIGFEGVRLRTVKGYQAGLVRFARLWDNKPHRQGVITHAWLRLTVIGAMRRREGIEKITRTKRGWPGSLMRAKSLITGWRITSSMLATAGSQPQSTRRKCSHSKYQLLSPNTDSFIGKLLHTQDWMHTNKSLCSSDLPWASSH